MKILYKPCTVLLLIVASCTSPKKETAPYDNDIIVLADVTDSLVVHPDPYYLSSQCGLSENPFLGIRLTASVINEYSITKEKTITLQPEDPLYSNRNVRQSKVTTFIKQLDTTLSDLKQDTVPKQRSAVYISVAHHLSSLSKSPAKNKAMYLYSDMLEHNDTLDFYTAETLARIKARPQEIISLLEKVHPMPDLTGISIYIMYCPDSKEANDRYDIVIRTFYKAWLETSKHATVYLKASQ